MSKLSPLMQMAHDILSNYIKKIENDECNEAQVSYAIDRLNAESKGWHNDNSYVNYDEAQRILGIPNRTKMKTLLKINGIETQRVKNMRVGFLRSEVEELAHRLQRNEK